MVTLIKNQRVSKRRADGSPKLAVLISPPVSTKTRGIGVPRRRKAFPRRRPVARSSGLLALASEKRERTTGRTRRLSIDGGLWAGIDVPVHNQVFLAAILFFVVVSLWLGTQGYPGSLVATLSRPVRLPDLATSDQIMRNRLQEDVRAGRTGGPVDIDPTRFAGLEFTTHTLRVGETLSELAATYGVSMFSIAAFNPEIEDVRRMRVGDVYRIPNRDGLPYVVQRGETLSGLATRHGISVNAILDANDLADATIYVGQELFIPEATMSEVEQQTILGTLFVWPVSGRITSAFGYRADPFTGRRTHHNGVDIANDINTPIGASRSGTVSHVGWSNLYGNFVIISHPGDGYQSLYAHLNRASVSTGQYVGQGDRVGLMGSTGYSTGSHLHFGILQNNGRAVDPMQYLH